MRRALVGVLVGNLAGWVFVAASVARLRRSFHSHGVR